MEPAVEHHRAGQAARAPRSVQPGGGDTERGQTAPEHAAAQQRFAALVEPHLPAVRAFLQRRDPRLEDDVMSEVGVVAWRRLDDLPAGHERAWLFGVARTVLMAERRKAAARHATELGESTLATVEAAALSPSVGAPLTEALATLAPRDRELLLLTAWEGLSTAEAASVIEIRPTAARMALVRARRRLAAALDDLDPGWRRQRKVPVAPDPPVGSDPPVAPDPPAPPHPRTTPEVPSCADARP